LSSGASRRDWSTLEEKVRQIDSIGVDILCILFDDIPSTGRSMAVEQLRICERIRRSAPDKKLIVCPTFYSTDPVLEKLFGTRPEKYWAELGIGLDLDVDVFWTGPKVCSEDYPLDHLGFVTDQLRRKVVLWDNYPVNDGERRSRFLYLEAFKPRHPRQVEYTAGHLSNPMNQPYLSTLPLSTLENAYGASDAESQTEIWQRYIAQTMPTLLELILEDASLFSQHGLDGITEQQKKALRLRYEKVSLPCAKEIVEWLDEQYWFDPACLTG
jgi:hypothetical protein